MLAQREAERERMLARLQLDAEESELQAKLAALDADKSDKSSRRSSRTSRGTAKRTESWVMNNDVQLADLVQPALMPELPMTSVVNLPPPLPTAPLNIAQDTQARLVPSATVTQPGPPIVTSSHSHDPAIKEHPSMNRGCADSNSQLAKAILTLAERPERPKRPELTPFTGDLDQWMSFKTTYDKTKHLFSSAENLTRLNNAVRGPAYQAIASHLWGSSDPEHVMSTLEQNFARPEILVAREIAGLRNIKISNVEHLNNLANKLRNCVCTIKYLRQYESLYSPELFRTVLTKLSEHTRSRFTDYAATHVMSFGQNMPKLEMLSEFLLVEADRQLKFNFAFDPTTASLSNKYTPFQPTFSNLSKPKPPTMESIHATVTKNNTVQCVYCKQGEHIINKCKAFSQLTIASRWQWIREHSVCYRCLKSHPHRWNFCRAKPCGTDGCTRRHHALLHGTSETTSRPNDHPPTATPGSSNTASKGIVATTILNTDSADGNASILVANLSESPSITTVPQPRLPTRGLLKVLPVVLEGPTGQFATTALFDEGSTATLIDSDVAARIGAKSNRKDQLRIVGVSGMSTDVDVSYVDFRIRGRNSKDCYLVQNARAIAPLGLRTQHIGKINYSDFPHLADLSDELSYEHINPTVLIGAADWYLSVSREIREGKKNEPVASRTLLGWVLHGAISTTSKAVDFIHYTAVDNIETCARSEYDELERLIKFQYDIDAIGIKRFTLQSDDEKRAIEIIESTAHRLSDGRFEVGLPWKQNLPKIIPDSYPQALSRLKALERQMSKNQDFATAFRRFLNDILLKGYAEKCDVTTFHGDFSGISTINSDSGIRWYLPIFGVYHPQKRKLRAVHDAAAKTKGVCLNSLLLQGPDLLQPLLDILFRFREGAVALNADIREMFPQIKISPKDRDAQRFLWRNDDGTIGEYRMASMIFGAVSSPFIAQYLKNKNAKELETTYPEACNAILRDHYMDDYLGSHSDVTEAARIAADILTVHKNCCYEMRSWTSNEPKALNLIPKEFHSQSNSEVHLPPNNSEVGVLGVRWNPLEDTLSFRTVTNFPRGTLTKRMVLSNVMKVYDPLGFLTPISIRGRILIQKLWREGTDWDAPLPETYAIESRNWFQQLQKAVIIRIPRWYLTKPDPVDTQLHLLADGGEQAYACVAYWRFAYENGSISLALIGSKARVAPLKPLSIPRLELQAALIACRLARTILNAHRIKPSAVFYWTDSTTVLKWIRSDARSFKPFVAHRLGEILELTNPSNWRWVPSLLNNADDATKPKSFDFNISHRWFTGPAFLLQPDYDWPVEVTSDMEEVTPASEVESELVGLLIDASTIDMSIPESARFSKWLRLVRTTARVIQAARIFRSFLRKPLTQDPILYTDGTTSPSELTATDIARAELLLFRRAQADQFPEEVQRLHSSQPVPRSSKLAALHPVLDDDGLIKLDSRIKAAPGMRMRVFIFLVALALATVCESATPQLRFAWKQIDYAWKTPADRENAISNGKFIPENNLPLGLARWKNKVFITVPKWKNGVVSSLNYIDVDGPQDQPYKPYPSFEDNFVDDTIKELPSNSTIISVFRVYVDSCDRLWVMDSGLADIWGSPNQVVGPSIVVFDLNTDQLIHRYFFKLEDMKEDSFFANIVVDTDKDSCDNAFAYVPDLGAYGVVVYSLKQDDSWRVTHHYFHFEPLAGSYNVGGVTFHWTDGVFSLALSEPRENGFRTLFFHALSSTKEFCVSTELLRNYTHIDKDEAFQDFKLLGDRGERTQSSAGVYDTKTRVLFYTQVNRDGVGCWNSNKPYTPENNPLIISDSNLLEFPNDLKIDDESNLWILSDRMPRFLYKSLDPNDVNYRIFSISSKDAIAGSACE